MFDGEILQAFEEKSVFVQSRLAQFPRLCIPEKTIAGLLNSDRLVFPFLFDRALRFPLVDLIAGLLPVPRF